MTLIIVWLYKRISKLKLNIVKLNVLKAHGKLFLIPLLYFFFNDNLHF